jgi:hypothetical protein
MLKNNAILEGDKYTINTYDGLVTWRNKSSIVQPVWLTEAGSVIDNKDKDERDTIKSAVNSFETGIPFIFNIQMLAASYTGVGQVHSITATSVDYDDDLYLGDTQPVSDTPSVGFSAAVSNPNVQYRGQIVCTGTYPGASSQSTEQGLRVLRFVPSDSVIPGVNVGCTAQTWPKTQPEISYDQTLKNWFRTHPSTPGFVYQLAERGGRLAAHVLMNQYGCFVIPKTGDKYWTHDTSSSDWIWTPQGPTTTEWYGIPQLGDGWVSRVIDPVTIAKERGKFLVPVQGVQMPHDYRESYETSMTRESVVLAKRPPRVRKDMWGVAAGIGGMATGLSGVLGQQAAWAQQSGMQEAYFKQQKWLMESQRETEKLRATLSRGGAAYAQQAGSGGMPEISAPKQPDERSALSSEPDAPDLVRAAQIRLDAAEAVDWMDERVDQPFIGIRADDPGMLAHSPNETVQPMEPPKLVRTQVDTTESGTAKFVDPYAEIPIEQVNSTPIRAPNPFHMELEETRM